MNITNSLIDRILEMLNKSKNDEAFIRDCFLDYVGVLIGGAYVLRDRHNQYMKSYQPKGISFAAGIAEQVDELTSALLNGLSAHVLELDDGHRHGMLHPGVTTFSALLALVRQESISPHVFFRAAVAGYEMTIRLACMVQPEHKKKGFHASATCGTIGAAFAVGIARGYSAQTLKNTVSAAATSASGLLEMIDDDSELKPYNCAQAAVNGILAANVAGVGYKGPLDAVGGRRGFIMTTIGTINDEKIRYALEIEDYASTIYRKLYASCRHTHPAVEAALRIREKKRSTSIIDIEVETYDLAVFGHDNTNPASVSAAKMSTPYSLSTALLYGKAGLDAFDRDLLENDEVRALAKRVKITADPGLSNLVPEIRSARVTVRYRDGSSFAEQVDYPKGEPENPLTQEELRQKFFTLLRMTGRNDDTVDQIYNEIYALEDSWDGFVDLITRRY